MASVNKDLGSPSIAQYDTKSTPNVPTAGRSATANLLTALGSNALKATEIILDKSIKDKFIGEEGEQIAGIDQNEDGSIKVTEDFDPTQTLNLNQIKVARDQGLISATQARVQVGKRIREASAKFPGQESTLRQYASQFFGEFGPAEGYLNVEPESKARDQFYNDFIAPGIHAGIIKPYGWESDVEGQVLWRKLSVDRTMRKEQVSIAEDRLKVGNITGGEAGHTWIDSNVTDKIADKLVEITQVMNTDGGIPDTKALLHELSMMETAQKQQLSMYLANSKTPIDAATRKGLDDRIQSSYAGLRQAVENGSLEGMLKEKNAIFVESTKYFGSKALPELMAAEVMFPGITKDIVALAPSFARMKTEASKNAWIAQQPRTIQMLFSMLGEYPDKAIDPFVDFAARGNPSGIPLLDQYFAEATRQAAKTSVFDPTQTPKDGKPAKDAYIATTLQLGGPEAIDTANDPSVAARIKSDPRAQVRLSQVFTSEYQAAMNTMQDNPYSIIRNPDGAYVVGPQKPGFETQIINPIAKVEEAQEIADSLNTMSRTVDTYGPMILGDNYDPILWHEQAANDFDPIPDMGGNVGFSGTITDSDGAGMEEGAIYEDPQTGKRYIFENGQLKDAP